MLKVNNNIKIKENIDRKYSAINHLQALRKKIILDNKEITTLLCILSVSINSISLNSEQKYNEKNKSKII